MGTPLSRGAPSLSERCGRFVCTMLAAWLASACEPRPRDATVALVTDLGGVTEPCGCTSKPLGGLDRLAGHLEALAAQGPVGLGVVGNTFFTYPQPPASLAGQERSKADVIARLLQRLEPWGIIPGADDTGAQRPTLEGVLQAQKLPVLWQRPSQSLELLGGTKVGVIGIPGSAATALLNEAASALRARGATLVLALVTLDGPQTRQAVAAAKGVDVVVTGGHDKPMPPQPVGEAIVVSAGSKGEQVGLLRLHPHGGAWHFFDAGAGQKQDAVAHRARLEAEALRLPEGEARTARLARVAQIDRDIAELVTTPPAGSYLTWEMSEISAQVPTTAWAKELLATYNRSLCAPALADSAKRTCIDAPENARYIGNLRCQACHAPAFTVYANTAHARAWATLTGAGKDCDLTCVGCHTVGFEKPGGFCHLQDAPSFANVGCESCHGPGSGHAAHPGERAQWAQNFVRAPDAAVCKGCHNTQHSDKFDHATYLPKVLGVGHGSTAVR